MIRAKLIRVKRIHAKIISAILIRAITTRAEIINIIMSHVKNEKNYTALAILTRQQR